MKAVIANALRFMGARTTADASESAQPSQLSAVSSET